ncbi:MAG TPA: metalloregulator ArsR/SmtB family transcription factor [Bryobacteraceae bacterium]|nr:metalloregulator ArsR/SmtB family transcription factor [Bryobacteraceae bacterium]
MSSILKALRLLADANRVRILLLLEREELSVAELQEILAKGQSQISTHLAQLRQAGLVEDRRTGKNIFYRLAAARGNDAKVLGQLLDLVRRAAADIPEAEQDGEALKLALRKRNDKMRTYFDELAGRFGREYVPGRSWKGLAEALLTLVPKITIADLGAGEGTFSQLLAQRAERVIAVDSSEKMVKFGAALARKHNVKNLEYRQGDMEDLPLNDASVDLAFFSQSLHHAVHPQKAVAEAARILKPGGRIVILDLCRHHFEEARELYADTWLGFTELELMQFLRKSGFRKSQAAIVHREQEPPHFETLLVSGLKPSAISGQLGG